MATCLYLELILCLELWEVPGTCCDTPSLLSLCSILFNLPSTMAEFSDLPFFSSPIALHLFTDLGQPVSSSHRCAWVVQAHEGSITHLCSLGFALLARSAVRRRAAGRSGWEGFCLPPSPSMGSKEQLFSIQHFSFLLPNPSREGNDSASLCVLPALRSKT